MLQDFKCINRIRYYSCFSLVRSHLLFILGVIQSIARSLGALPSRHYLRNRVIISLDNPKGDCRGDQGFFCDGHTCLDFVWPPRY